MSKLKYAVFLCLLGVFLCFASPTQAATLWFNPTSATYGKDSTLKVTVGVNTAGEAVNAVQANIAYPTDKLQFSSISTGGSAMTIIAEKTGGGGMVRLGGGTPTPGFSGSKYLATIYFKVLADSGTASLSFVGGSAVLRNSDNQNVLSGSSVATFQLSGVSAQLTDSETSETGESGVSEEGGEDVEQEGFSQEGETKGSGYKIIIKVVDTNGKKLVGADVYFYPGPFVDKTDENGEIEFSNVSLGKHGITVKYEGRTLVKEINIQEAEDEQTFEAVFPAVGSFVNVKKVGKSYLGMALISLSVVLVIALVAGLYIRAKKRNRAGEAKVVDLGTVKPEKEEPKENSTSFENPKV